MAGREGRRRRRKAGPGKGGEGKGTRRSCGSSRDGGAVLAAAPVRRETHSNRPLAMTQQHAVPLQNWRRRGAERRGGAWRVEKPERWEGSRERRRRARRRARRLGSRPLRHYRWAPAHCTARAAPAGHVGLAPPSLAAGGVGTWYYCGFLKKVFSPVTKRWVRTSRGFSLLI